MEPQDTVMLKRGPGRPPKMAEASAAALNLANRVITAVQFKDPAQFLSRVASGLHTVNDKADIRLIGPGVYICLQGREYVVPFANVKHISLAPLTDDTQPAA